MSILKYAFNLGYKEAIKEAAMTPAQMQAAQIAGGVGGGLLGAGGGGLLGKYLGEQAGLDPRLGGGIGALLGGGAGAVLGSQLPRAIGRTEPAPHKGEERVPDAIDQGVGLGATPMDESALGALPIAYGGYDPYAEAVYQQAMQQDPYGGY